MGCNASKPVGGDDGYLLRQEESGGYSHKDMMQADPDVKKAAAQIQNKPPPPPHQYPSAAKAPQGGGGGKTYNRAKDRIDAIPESKRLETKEIRLRYAYFSQRGFYPDDPFKPNQDSYCVHEATSQVTQNGVVRLDSLFGVFDGHGKDGHHCAQFARANLPIQFKLAMEKARAKQGGQIDLNREQIHASILRAHVETNRQLHRNPQIDDSLSGTTAITVYFHGRKNRITIANVGDSRAVLGSSTGPPREVNGQPIGESARNMLKAQPLSRDQTPYRKDESKRIRNSGGRILSLDQLEGLEPITDPSENDDELELGEELDEGGDPPRVWAPNGDYPGTAFTRSIGDAMAEELGVFAEPEMLSRELRPEDRIIVCASDGVFEFLTNQSVIDICAKFDDPLDACRAVVAEAYELWLQYELRTDDITIIVIFIDELRYSPGSRRHSFGGGSMASSKPDFGVDESRLEQQKKQLEDEEEDDDVEDESDEEPMEEQVVDSGGFKPVRKNVSKEKAKEIEKLRAMGSAANPEPEFDLKKLATPKTEAEKKSIEEAIKASVMFRNITNEQRELIYSCMESVDVKEGTWVIKQGTVGDKYYIIDEGKFEVRILPDDMEDETGEGGNIIHLYEGSRSMRIHPSFGELALMYSAPRSASIIAKSDGHLWALHRAAFRHVLIEAQDTRKDLKKVLGEIPFFKGLDMDGINTLAGLMDEVTFARGRTIVDQGQPGKYMYVIKKGACYTTSMIPGHTKRATLKAKSFFGDEIFSTSEGFYMKTVVSLQTTVCWQIDKATLQKELGSLLKAPMEKK